MLRTLILFAAALAGLSSLHADEGMWTYNNFPTDKVKAGYGFAPDQAWLDHVRLSSARFGQGCSASFVSPNGLIMTNHHCARSCVQNLSSAENNYIEKGFYARTAEEEKQCPALEINQLTEITDVTGKVGEATKGLSGGAFTDALDGAKARIEKECATSDKVHCEVVTLYNGGRYDLYKYRRYDDVRLVFAPEERIAFFGGDPDNFNFPRYDFDISFVRIYENGAPVHTDNYFRWSPNGSSAGDLTFVSGHPGRTEREKTIAQLEYERDRYLPQMTAWLAEYRGLLTEFQTRGAEQARTSNSTLFTVENSLKVYKGRQEALVDKQAFAAKAAEERSLQQKVDKNRKWNAEYGRAWDNIAKAVVRERELDTPYLYIERGRGFQSKLYTQAKTLVRAAAELPKSNEKRLPEYVDSKLPTLRQGVASKAPIYGELEIETLTFSLTKLREVLGPDDPFVRKMFGPHSPREIATELVQGSRLNDPAVRQQLLDGGEAAIDASGDPMIVFAKQVDGYAREIRKKYEDEVDSIVKENGELLGKARFAAYGTSIYPDATFTLRLSYGSVKGWAEKGTEVKPYTELSGAYERATGRDPFRLPESWLEARSKLNLSTPMNLVTTNDIIGGNSGSPMINRRAEIIGLVFDGNIHSLGGDYWFDEKMNRTVAVDSRIILEGLDNIYGAKRLVSELKPTT